MKRWHVVLIVLILAIIIFITGFIIYKINIPSGPSSYQEECTDLGCPVDTAYVGSINSDKYYECSCHYADTILPENIVCFVSDADAIEKGYTKSDC